MDVCLNGKFIEKNDAMISIADHGFLYGDGVYETLRTVNGKLWLIDEHLKRLRESLETVGIKMEWKNNEIVNLAKVLMERGSADEYRVRLTVTRGSNHFDMETSPNPTLLIEAVPLTAPSNKIYENGVSAITFDGERPFPLVKSTSMLTSIMARREVARGKVFEAFLVDRNQNVTEGSISNIFAISGEVIYTPKERILEGTVRNLLIELLQNEFEVRITSIAKKDINDFDEVFLTSSIKGIVPVVEIDGKRIGDGKVGKVTKRAMEILKENMK
jgi:branched-chain amino acid aminotransferase